MTKNNEKKRFGRRAGFGLGAVVLLTTAFYITLFKEVELDWFTKYSTYMVGLLAFIIGGLTATDIWGKK